jgi:transcriptional regulator with XRE-family HTH domain
MSEKANPSRHLIARNIETRRRVLGISKSELSRKSGLSRPTIDSVLDASGNMPSLSTLQAIAKALDARLEWILTGRGDPALVAPAADVGVEALLETIRRQQAEIRDLRAQLEGPRLIRAAEPGEGPFIHPELLKALEAHPPTPAEWKLLVKAAATLGRSAEDARASRAPARPKAGPRK